MLHPCETMKSLLLLRHAKSSWKDSTLADHERPLKKRGRRATVMIGRFLRKHQLRPDLVVSSTAQRARETVERLLVAAAFDVEVRYDRKLYLATPNTLTETVAQLDPGKKQVLLVGHNPGLEDFLYQLTGIRDLMPTAALAHVVLETEQWSDVSTKHRWQLKRLVKPKDLLNQ